MPNRQSAMKIDPITIRYLTTKIDAYKRLLKNDATCDICIYQLLKQEQDEADKPISQLMKLANRPLNYLIDIQNYTKDSQPIFILNSPI